MILVHKQVSVLGYPDTSQVSASVTWPRESPSRALRLFLFEGAECWVLFSTRQEHGLPSQSHPQRTGTGAGQRLLWHKEHPARVLKSILGLVNRPCKGDRGPSSPEGQRTRRWGVGRARNNIFLSKILWVLGLDVQPGVYSICSHIHSCDCVYRYICLSLQVAGCVLACST